MLKTSRRWSRRLVLFVAVAVAVAGASATLSAPASHAAEPASPLECTSIPANHDPAVIDTVYRVGLDRSVSDKVMLAAFEAGWVESHMNNLPCGDKDSLGVFQQRPSQGWGTPEQIMNVEYATTQFMSRAQAAESRFPGYTAAQLAQEVQRSCCGERYAEAEAKARSLMALAKPPGARTVVALTPERTAVMRFNGSPGSWTQIGGPARSLIGGGGLAAITPDNQSVMRHLGSGRWERAGGPGTAFVFAGSKLYALGPGSNAVLTYNGTPGSWTQIGGPAQAIYGGGAGLLATTPGAGNVMHYAGAPYNWVNIGGPGGTFGVTNTHFYGETPTQSAIMRYSGSPGSWAQIGGPGRIHHAGGYGLLAIAPTTSDAMLYRPATGWVRIGGPGRQFVVTDDTVYALTADGNAVMRYNGSANSWTQIGGPAAQIVPSP
jgi:hypothetical protein